MRSAPIPDMSSSSFETYLSRQGRGLSQCAKTVDLSLGSICANRGRIL
jgi:hypothetical protein